MSNTMLTYVIR